MNFTFHPIAVKELQEAIDYYENINYGLGSIFSGEVYSTIQRILQFPKAWTKISQHCRRCLTQRFPYGIIYQVKKNEIVIISVMQLNRKPKKWDDFI
ncbi:MAG: type II toxin-antitoxin system RelE/ParE family toxin [Candidatus Lokiarchaeota archaeon]|nr:type II toxin-antitoxin system RelE/ParE family toxin [Candidatus Lokiarchaeota archaeon]